ncbi:MAG: hypothetical protein CMQ25_02555 [Gammaproteobacteria bacterium]|nr:hypothetical protein [Gammaproteobacteria bacterium]|tara:strand:+ start:151 stop:642 length:492 start_codon:yes stop_codon:yes gene_type:complete
MSLPREIALSDEEIDDVMTDQWNLRIATIGPGTKINLTPMWFGWVQGKIYISARGQKVVNLRRNPQCTVLVDKNEKFPELQGIMMDCRAVVLESKVEEEGDPDLKEARIHMGEKYNGGHGQPVSDRPKPLAATAGGKNRRWLVLTPEKILTWDNYKLDLLRKP